ncbi:MAG: glutamine--fructose-6-phosphate transaminase (isomerizing) [Candidatus Omnitrophica bacterium]|nr:glutamine--fructose-6-phosphate transaminase (isomerizing) [Candidatus Omnitrophota bacterium]
MCGIIGYTGAKDVSEVLLKGLARLEYRGYDSAGLAVLKDEAIRIVKKQGKLEVLAEEVKQRPIEGNTGIGHTRWATHGEPSDLNAHPHNDHTEDVAIAHNGIIENYKQLKEQLGENGHIFKSETDSEVIAHLIASEYQGDLRLAVAEAAKRLKGSFAIAAIHKKEPDRIIGIRKDSPLILGLGEEENFIASDIPAVLEHTKEVVYLENNEMVDIKKGKYTVYDEFGSQVEKISTKIEWDIKQAEKTGFKHFMLKEIFEQPEVLKQMFQKRIKNDTEVVFDELIISEDVFKKIENVIIVACGTAYHAGLTGRYMIEKYARIPVSVDTSSEFRYRDPLVDKNTLVIVISQSGETADTLAALREAKTKGAKVLAICNVLGASIARESDGVIYTHAGPEIAVASTKAYTAQLGIMYLFTHYLTKVRGKADNCPPDFLKELSQVPKLAKRMLKQYRRNENKMKGYAANFHKYYLARNNKSCFLYLGRNINYPNALEGALKLKEISYISAEGYPAGEMKHGPIALIDENPWVVCLAVKGDTYEKMLSNIQEIRARGGIIVAIVSERDSTLKGKEANYVIEIPETEEIFSPILVAIPLQLLAYHVAAEFGYDIDKPRNLAKSVTVE